MSRSLRKRRIRDLAGVLIISGVAIVVVAGLATVRIWQQGERDERRPVDAIVVLGAAQYNGHPSPVFKARLDHAIELWRSGIAHAFVVTGGKLPGDRTTEAAVARQYAIDHGVPASAIYGEHQAHNTLDSLTSVATMMRRRGDATAEFVSDPTHMLRVLRIAQDLGVEGYGSPTTTSPLRGDLAGTVSATAHELGALAVYFLTGEAPAVEHP